MTGWHSRGWVLEINIKQVELVEKHVNEEKTRKTEWLYLRSSKLHNCSCGDTSQDDELP